MREVRARDVGYARAGRSILAGASMAAYAGEVLVVTGPSGSGKSSLLALLAGLEAPTAGRVEVDGAPMRVGDTAMAQRMGLVLQGYGLVSVLTAAENVELVLQSRDRSASEAVDRARAALARVGMADVADHLTEELSGGQQQRVAIARALVAEPELVLADEPTAELDAANRAMVLSLLVAQARRGAVVILASHDREVADAGDRELHLLDGQLVDVAVAPLPVPVPAAAATAGVVASPPVEPGHEPAPGRPPAAAPAARPARTGWERPQGR